MSKHTKDKSVDHKLLLMKRKFGEEIPLSRSTIWNVIPILSLITVKIQRKVLNYSYKRISTYIPKDNHAPPRLLKRIFFIREFINYVQDEDTELFVLDEAGKIVFIIIIFLGFGTSPFSNYSYGPVGEKVVKHTPHLYKNITVCATISCHKTEMLRYFSGGGTKKEIFEEYFIELMK